MPSKVRCRKVIVRYHYCKHDAETEYRYCGGDHEDSVDEREKCWEAQPKRDRNLSTGMETTMDQGGVCSRDCDAEYVGFHCCICEEFIHANHVLRNNENFLIHMLDGVEHEFCDDCDVKYF